MIGPVLIIALAAAAQSSSLPATQASLATSAAQQLFERDWVLMNWALKFFDSDRDILLEPREAEAAAVQFRKIADTDNDGRVTPQEYRDARALILARY
jgi:hypothetical protein